jgi:hypothetical protein
LTPCVIINLRSLWFLFFGHLHWLHITTAAKEERSAQCFSDIKRPGVEDLVYLLSCVRVSDDLPVHRFFKLVRFLGFIEESTFTNNSAWPTPGTVMLNGLVQVAALGTAD